MRTALGPRRWADPSPVDAGCEILHHLEVHPHIRMRLLFAILVALLLSPMHFMMAQAGPPPDSVRRVAPDSFPQLPTAVRHDLERRECLVPQPYDARKPANVARGAFTAPRISEWAILCSAHDTSQILIYRVSSSRDVRAIDSLERAADVAWMQRISDTQWGFSRLLGTLPLDRIRTWRRDDDGRSIPRPIDHDAIEQTFIGKAADAFYRAAGRWYRRATAD